MNIKKLLSILVIVAVLANLALCGVSADDSTTVYVTIANGELCLAQKAVTVTDVDGDGALTLCDALQLAHTEAFEGGADGFEVSNGLYGLYITKLWGIANGGSYGIYVNNTSAMGVGDPVKNGDQIYAFCYTDLTAFSDSYCFFNTFSADVVAGEELTLTLTALGYNENWELIEKPVTNAALTVDGTLTEFKTDESGKVTISLTEVGSHTLGAQITDIVAIPPICTVCVNADTPSVPTGDSAVYTMLFAVMAAALGTALTLKIKKSRECEEK